MDSNAIRAAFLQFFSEKSHRIIPSAPIVNKDDPTLMFINAGMNPFKDIFTGNKPVGYPRIANSQKCLRVSGKHNDLEEVGHDTYHHTMFEMLGNWSFGDYFRTEAIAWGWAFLTEVLKIDKARLYVTVFEGDAEANVPADTASVEEWRKCVPADRIIYAGKKDNFWEMGETGPCGPCTEIHIDLRADSDRAKIAGADLVNKDSPEVIEIWNIVFIQYDRKADGTLVPLEMKSVDTGMGLERLALVMQNKRATYDTDVFQPLFAKLQELSGIALGHSTETDVAQRVAVDHIRALAFTIADGQLPGNNGAGYVVRRLLRRASRYGYRFLNLQQPYLCELIAPLVEKMGAAYPELASQQAFITQVIAQEEKSFLATLAQGIQLFDQHLAKLQGKSTQVAGQFAFELYDTFGFPLDLTDLMAKERGYAVDLPGFEQAMADQKARSKAAAGQQVGDWQVLMPDVDPRFVGYDQLSCPAQIVRMRTVTQKKGKQYQLVLDQTPFYAESGGQVGDTGTLQAGGQTLRVLDTLKENTLTVHIVDKLPEAPQGQWQAAVDAARRMQVRAAHSATHLLHAALREVLGEHVEQRGSLVQPEVLRFDFSHYQKVTDEEIQRITARVNAQIAAQLPREEHRDIPIAAAKEMGAMALFGEKYGEQVRVIRFGEAFSTELCGGTHVDNTSEIRLMVVTAESSIAAGIRRIEALTGTAALNWLQQRHSTLQAVETLMLQPKDLLKSVEQLHARSAQLEKQLAQMRGQAIMAQREPILAQMAHAPAGHQYVCIQVEAWTADDLKQLAFELKRQVPNGAFVLGAVVEGKVLMAVMLGDAVVTDKMDARQLIKAISTHIQGGGGGQPFFATAGGKRPEGLPDALAAARELLSV